MAEASNPFGRATVCVQLLSVLFEGGIPIWPPRLTGRSREHYLNVWQRCCCTVFSLITCVDMVHNGNKIIKVTLLLLGVQNRRLDGL